MRELAKEPVCADLQVAHASIRVWPVFIGPVGEGWVFLGKKLWSETEFVVGPCGGLNNTWITGCGNWMGSARQGVFVAKGITRRGERRDGRYNVSVETASTSSL